MATDILYDLLVYHDFTDNLHDRRPEIGQDARQWFGESFDGLYVTAVAPGIHHDRTLVVLSNEARPDMQQEIKAYFGKQ